MTHDGKPIPIEITVILRRDVGDTQYVLAESCHGFVITGMNRITKELIVTPPIENMDAAIEQFRKEISK